MYQYLTLDDSLKGITARQKVANEINRVKAMRLAGKPVGMKLAVQDGKVIDYCYFDPKQLLHTYDDFHNANGYTRWQEAGTWEL